MHLQMRGARVVRAAIRAHGGQHPGGHPTGGVGQGGGRALSLQTHHQFSSSSGYRKDPLAATHTLGTGPLDGRCASSSLDAVESIAQFPQDWVAADPVFPETRVPADAQPAIVALDDSWNDDDSLFAAEQPPASAAAAAAPWLPSLPTESESPLKPHFSEFMDLPFSMDGTDFSSWMSSDVPTDSPLGLWDHEPRGRQALSPAELFPSIFLDLGREPSQAAASPEDQDLALADELEAASAAAPSEPAPAAASAAAFFPAPSLTSSLFAPTEARTSTAPHSDPIFPSPSSSLASLATDSSPSTVCPSPYSSDSQPPSSASSRSCSPDAASLRQSSPSASSEASNAAELRFACSFLGCGRSYSTKGNLTQHLKSCHDPNPKRFSCPVCPKEFVKKSGVREHVRRVHDHESYVREFLCELCGKGFTKRYNMTRHVRACPKGGARSAARARATKRQQQQL